MGLAANQARLLTLTSRMSDLELRCQTLSNQKIMMTALSGNVSLKYNEMLTAANNIGAETITTYQTITNTNSQEYTTLKMKDSSSNNYVSFNYNTLKGMGYEIAAKGSMASASSSGSGSGSSSGAGSTVATGSTGANSITNWTMPTSMRGLMNLLGNSSMGKGVLDSKGATESFDQEGGTLKEAIMSTTGRTFQIDGFKECGPNKYYSMVYYAQMFAEDPSSVPNDLTNFNQQIKFSKEKLEKVLGPQTTEVASSNNSGSSSGASTTPAASSDATPTEEYYTYDTNAYVDEAKANADVLVEGLLNGSIGIFKDGQEVALGDVGISTQKERDTNTSTQQIATQSLDYSKRDAARQSAQSYYERETNKLSRQEQMLDLMSKAADTEYSAVTTEYESVKSLIGENAEKGFSLFG